MLRGSGALRGARAAPLGDIPGAPLAILPQEQGEGPRASPPQPSRATSSTLSSPNPLSRHAGAWTTQQLCVVHPSQPSQMGQGPVRGRTSPPGTCTCGSAASPGGHRQSGRFPEAQPVPWPRWPHWPHRASPSGSSERPAGDAAGSHRLSGEAGLRQAGGGRDGKHLNFPWESAPPCQSLACRHARRSAPSAVLLSLGPL